MARRKREEEQEPVDYELVKLNGINVRIPTIKLTPRHIAALKQIRVNSDLNRTGIFHEDITHFETFGLAEYLEKVPSLQDMRAAKNKALEAIKSLEKIIKRQFSDKYRKDVIQEKFKMEEAIHSISVKRTVLRITPKGESVLAAFEKANKSDYSVESTPQQ